VGSESRAKQEEQKCLNTHERTPARKKVIQLQYERETKRERNFRRTCRFSDRIPQHSSLSAKLITGAIAMDLYVGVNFLLAAAMLCTADNARRSGL
jgi:hypothetical protein